MADGETIIDTNWVTTTLLPIFGGVTGIAWIAYMVLMANYARKKDQQLEAARRDIAEIKGILLGANGRKR